MKKKTRVRIRKFQQALPYILTAAVTIAVVFVGSLDKKSAGINLSLNVFAENNYRVSVDQLSELYMVADLSDALGIASASDVANNYVLTTSMYEAGQTSAGKTEKPSIIDLPTERGVIEYVVSEGETMDSIAAKYKITTDQIRWSNGLKTTNISAGTKLYLPSVSGIVYTVKANDTVESIASKYGGTAEEIIALNDLEVSGISTGMRILIKNGTLPNTERPEYVPPVVQYHYTYLGNTSERQNIQVIGYRYGLGGPYGGGQCTQWAWFNRQDLPSNLGNANSWANRARAAGFPVSRTPSAGAVFQTSSGWYGHVGYVEAVNSDGSITVTEMNYNYRTYLVIRATIPASAVGNFNYIHYR
jgi:LysM repeat protein